jgi:hypothetical protein
MLHQALRHVPSEGQSIEQALVFDNGVCCARDNAISKRSKLAGAVVSQCVGELDGLLGGPVPHRLCFHVHDRSLGQLNIALPWSEIACSDPGFWPS